MKIIAKALSSLLFITHFCFAQTVDSTVIKNNQRIENLKQRISNIVDGNTYLEEYIKQNETLRQELEVKNILIEKLNTIIKQFQSEKLTVNNLNNNPNGANFFLKDCNCFRLFYEPNEPKILGKKFEDFIELDSLVLKCNASATAKLKLVGHTDKVGKENHNEMLSKERVMHLRSYLINTLHVSKEKIITEWHGSNMPIDKNKEALNRRVEVFLEYKAK